MGDFADDALNTLFVLVKQIAFKSRRRLRVHAPGCSAISGDELLFLGAIAAAQTEEAEEPERLWLSRLIGQDADPGLVASVRALARVLAMNGQRLSLGALGELSAPPAASGTVH